MRCSVVRLSTQRPPSNPNSAAKHENADANQQQQEGWWERARDPIAVLTLCLVVVGAVQLGFFYRQLSLIGESLIDAKRAADAAKLSADHIPRVERAYLSGGGGKGQRGEFEVHVNNFGKTPAELIRMEFGFCEADDIPPVPKYTVSRFFQDAIKPSDSSRYLEGMDVPIPANLKKPVIYGRYYYRDIFTRDDEPLHSCGFILEIRGGARTTWPIEAPRAYTAWD